MRLKQQPERLAAASHGVQLHHRVGESRRGAARTTAGQLSAPPYTSAMCARCKSNAVAVVRIQTCYLWSWQAGRQCLFGRQGVEGVDARAAGGKRGAKVPSARRPAACSVGVSRCLDAFGGAGRPLPVRVARVRARGRGRGAASAAPSPGKKFTLLWSADPSPELKCQSSSGPCRPAARWPPVQQARSLGVIPPLLNQCSCH